MVDERNSLYSHTSTIITVKQLAVAGALGFEAVLSAPRSVSA